MSSLKWTRTVVERELKSCIWKRLFPPISRFTGFTRMNVIYIGKTEKKIIITSHFLEVFKGLNISLFKLKKDECDVCVSYRANNLSHEDHELHREQVEKVREEKRNNIKSGESLLCAVF